MVGFDWYQGTVRRPVDDVLEVLGELVPGALLSHGRGAHGYAHAAVLGTSQDGAVARVWHGGSHEYPHAVLSGEWAQPGAELIRAHFPAELHTVSRCDVREDFIDAGAYDVIEAHLVEVARAHRLKVGTAGDHLVTMEGRTVYLGAPSSAVRLRLYDKRAEILSKLPPYGEQRQRAWVRIMDSVPDHLARLEAQIRPATKEARQAFSTIEPVDALGCSAWMREVWRVAAGLEVMPVQVGRKWRQSDDERAYRFLLAQYGGVLRRMHADAGSWECVGLQLGEDLRCTNGG